MELHENYKDHVRRIVCACDAFQKNSLLTVLNTRNANAIPHEHRVAFTNQGLLHQPNIGPPHVREEIEPLVRELLEKGNVEH